LQRRLGLRSLGRDAVESAVTSISLVISRTGSTFELSTAP
jgi:hypothetical protein